MKTLINELARKSKREKFGQRAQHSILENYKQRDTIEKEELVWGLWDE